MKDKSIAYSFSQLIKFQQENYESETDNKQKETIALKFICDPNISKDILNRYTNICKLDTKSDKNTSEIIFNTFENFYHIFQYSLPANDNLKYYNVLKVYMPEKMSQLPSYEYLTLNDPINNFKNICSNYSIFLAEIDDLSKSKQNLKNINNYIEKMVQIYDYNLAIYYYPPTKEYPIFTYNFYSYLFFKTLNKFKYKKKRNLFTTNQNDKKDGPIPYGENEAIEINYNIGLFFKDVSKLFDKFDYKNIEKDLIILKVIFFYFQSLENTRNFKVISQPFRKIINCLDSKPITKEILKRFKFYRKNSTNPIKEEEWDSIRINEFVYIEYPMKLKVKIKQFKKDILSLNNEELLRSLSEIGIDNLNLDGLIQNSISKYSPEIEEYTKKLIKSIFSSENYRNNFLKNDKRFSSYTETNELLKSIFEGPNSNLIFEEIWENIFFVPFLDKELAGLNSRPQFSIFIKSDFDSNTSFQKIIPYFHSEINTLYHEFTHNIALILAANLEEENFETIIIKDSNKSDDLINLQNKYFYKYNQNNYIYSIFDDFGNVMEIELYGIRPRKFRTFSGLFCLNYHSYNLKLEIFRETCARLYNYEIKKGDNSQKLEEKNRDKDDCKEILDSLMNSEIAKLLMEHFEVDDKNENETYIEDGKPREISFNSMINEEYSINIDYCDKFY